MEKGFGTWESGTSSRIEDIGDAYQVEASLKCGVQLQTDTDLWVTTGRTRGVAGIQRRIVGKWPTVFGSSEEYRPRPMERMFGY